MQSDILKLAQRIADGAALDPVRFEDWLPFNATNWWIRPMDNGETFCKVFGGNRIDQRVAELAILMHWQQRMDADTDKFGWVIIPPWQQSEKFNLHDDQFELQCATPGGGGTCFHGSYPSRSAALCAYVETKIGASDAR